MAAEQDVDMPQHIQNYGIDSSTKDGQKALEEIAEIIAIKNGKSITANIQKFGIKSEEARIKIAKMAAEQDVDMPQHIQNYGIDSSTKEGQKALEEIAEIIAIKNGKSITANIQKFGIKSEKARIKIAKMAAEQDVGMPWHIQNYGINPETENGQKTLKEIAEIIAIKNGGGISICIQELGIKSAEARIKIARIAAGKNGFYTSQYIKNYGIDSKTEEGQRALIEIAKIAAANNGWGTSQYIKEYEIDSSTKEGQKALVEIAKIAAATQDEFRRLLCIKNFEIDLDTQDGQKALEEIAEIAAIKNGGGISRGIQEFGIKAEESRVKIARIAAADNGIVVSFDIKNYQIDSKTEEGQKALIEIAKIAAANSGEKTSQYIKNYEIDSKTEEGKKGLAKIAKIATTQNGRGALKYIKNYEIDSKTEEGQKALIEIAKIAAANDELEISSYIHHYEIDSSVEEGLKFLVKIAKIAAAQGGYKTSQYIKNYGIDSNTEEGLKVLIEIAKIAAANSGEGTSQYIKNYGIDSNTEEGRKALVEIAKIAATNHGWGTSQNIQNYGIDSSTEEGQKTLIEIAKIALKQDVLVTSQFLSNYLRSYPISDLIIHNDLSRTLMDSVLDQLQTFSVNEFKKFSKALEVFFDLNKEEPFLGLFDNNTSLDQTFDNFKQLCRKQLELPADSAKTFITWLNESYTSIKNDHDKQKFLEWITVLTIFSSVSGKTGLVMQNINLLNSIRRPPPFLRDLLTKELLGFYIDFSEEKNNLLQKFRNKCKLIRNEKGEEVKKLKTPPIHTELISLIFAGYPAEAQEACLNTIEKIKGEREFLREKTNKKILLETLVRIKNCSVTPNAKKCVIEQLFHLDGKERLDACKLVRNLINFKELTYLHYLEKNEPTEDGLIKDLENSLGDFFKKTFQTSVEDFCEKYTKTFETWRSIDSLITFAGKMNSLVGPEKDEPLKLLSEVVTNVLNDDFQTKRYETDNNPHMEFLKNEFPEVFEKWKNNLSLDLSEVVTDNKQKKVSPLDAIKKQMRAGLRNEHLGKKELYPHIEKFINNSSELNLLEGIEKDLKSLNEKRKASDDGKFSKEDIELRKRLLIEKNVLELFTIDQVDDLEKGLKSLINKLPRNNDFRQTDLEACLKLLTNENSEVGGFKVIESDHPNNLLLMGTEVNGSCQSVNGSPGLNKCLLSYIVDSKNKLPLIVDAQGKILARAVIRILFDKNNKPVVFLEDMYTSGSNPLYAPNLRKLALKKARDLGIPLVALNRNKGEHFRPFDSAVFAKEKPVTFEYVDALYGIQKGPYSIANVVEIIE